MSAERVIYLKGGRAIEEAQRLFPRIGELPDGGPDKFLLAVLHHTRAAVLRLTSFGPSTQRARIEHRDVIEYAARAVTPSKLGRRWAFLKAAATFILDTLTFHPTHVLCGVDGPFAVFAWAAARLSGARFIFLVHSAMALPNASSPYKLTNGFLCRRADQIITHGPFVREEALQLGAPAERVIEFNNGLDPEHRALLRQLPPKHRRDANATVLYVGRIEVDKGVIDLLHAYSAVPRPLGTKLRYVGSGGAEAELKALVQAQGLQDEVEVLGPVPFEQVFTHMREALVVVTPSQSRFPEGFCKSAMEAFYVGTPVIAPDYGPFPYMVQHEVNGLLYTADKVDALATAIHRLLAEPSLQSKLEAGAVSSGAGLATPSTTFNAAIGLIFHH